jgi:hypothetical protein
MVESVEIMVQIAQNKDVAPQVRLNSCIAILQQAARWTETIDILQRIEKLEAQQNDR